MTWLSWLQVMWNQVQGLTRVGSQLWRTLSGSDKLRRSVYRASPSELPLTNPRVIASERLHIQLEAAIAELALDPSRVCFGKYLDKESTGCEDRLWEYQSKTWTLFLLFCILFCSSFMFYVIFFKSLDLFFFFLQYLNHLI